VGRWAWGLGGRGVGLGRRPQPPNPQTPNPQSPIPNPHFLKYKRINIL